MTFRVGQRVVCVKSGSAIIPGRHEQAGEVYTIREILTSPFPRDNGQTGIYLEEICAGFGGIMEFSYYATHFRPVQEQGMSILRAIAANPKQKIKENA